MNRGKQDGSTLIEALIAITIFSFALMGLAAFQVTTLKNDILSGERVEAAYLADEILGFAHADAANATCYTVPATGVCANTAGQADASAWASQVEADLPGASALTPTVSYSGSGTFTVDIQWERHDAARPHNYAVTTAIQAAP